MNLEDSVLAFVDTQSAPLVEFCRALVRCPTENPPGDTLAVSALVRHQLDEWGVSYKEVTLRPDAPNLVATVENGPGRHLVFNGHMDVFPAGDRARWDRDPFSGDVVEGRLLGRGSGDMKGGFAASLWAFGTLLRHRDVWQGRMTFTAVSEEETFGPGGARHLVEQVPDEVLGDGMINGEPSSTNMMRCGERGLVWLKLEVKAPGGHSAYPHRGRSAVKGMLALIADLERAVESMPFSIPPAVRAVVESSRQVADANWGAGAADNLLRITTNIGTLHGGEKINLKPQTCTAEFDIRLPPGVDVQNVMDKVIEVVNGHEGASFEALRVFPPSFVDPESAMYRAAGAAVEKVVGERPAMTLSLATGDSRLWRWAGVPAVTLGPRHFNGATANEYILVEDLINVCKIHTLAGLKFLTRTGC